jgi:hypothetical protein
MSARKRRAWVSKSGLGRGVAPGLEYKLDGVSNIGELKVRSPAAEPTLTVKVVAKAAEAYRAIPLSNA